MKMFKTDEEAVSPVKALRTVHDDAVSPVIGVILMVAIVVILAAVIAAFVFGMAGSTGTAKNVGMTVSLNGADAIDIVWQGGQDINSLDSITATLEGTDPQNEPGPFTVGQVTSIGFASNISPGRVIITGAFTDGSNQVLFDRRY